MEEFEHMIVEDFTEEDFYEKIEAPKFVDLTAPDHRPEGDDRYWFCSRVGCDQMHEEFMDSEVIYKKFLLRVMAARSPSVRLRKAHYRNDLSVEPKCPNTVPAKPSRSCFSRLAMISSIPQKANGNIRSKGVKAIPTNKKNATPKGKGSTLISSVSRKALTERKKQLQSPSGFRSVQNPRTGTVKPSGNRFVAKSLVFYSPKKVVKLKRSVELSSSVKKLCSGMRKLEIENKRDGFGVNHKVGASVPTNKRQLKSREVKSRVFDSLRSEKQINEKAKQKVKEKEELVLSSENTSGDEEFLVENSSEELTETWKTNMDDQFQAKEDHDVIKKSEIDKEEQHQTKETEDKENVLALECENKENVSNAASVGRDDSNALDNALKCDDKENATNAADVDIESDDKENSSVLENNRKVDQAIYPSMKRKVFGKKETCKTTQKAMTIADKCFNSKIVSANTRVKYTKPKLTNPKPFRLRTDERSILKEANTEKKPQCVLAKEEESTNILRFHGENMGPKHQPHREKNTTSRLKACKGTSTTLDRHDSSENTVNGKRVVLGKKKQVASKRTETMEKTSLMNGESKEVTVMRVKTSVCAVASGEKRFATVPKGPNFHRVHVPKNCTKRAL